MIISKTPVRISLFGGSTDYIPYVEKHGGLVVGTTIDKYIYITVRNFPSFFDFKSKVSYSEVEHVKDNNLIKHKIVRGILRHLNIHQGVEINHMCDVPSWSGVGSSSAFIVGLLNCLQNLEGLYPTNPYALYQQAVFLEQKVFQECVGLQDSAWAAFGGFNTIKFEPDGKTKVCQFLIDKDTQNRIENSLLLFYTGISRQAQHIAQSYVTSDMSKTEDIHHAIKEIAKESINPIYEGNVEKIGQLLHESWELKKTLSDKITKPEIDNYYNKAIDSGAYGCKITGAGGGGFFLVCAEPKNHEVIRNSLSNLLEIPFRFENKGSHIL